MPFSNFRRKKSPRGQEASLDAEGKKRWSSASSASSAASAVQEEEERSYGIEEWISGENPNVDVVFIHGLNGHRENTWTAENSVLWPKQLLPSDLPHARILAFGYDSRTHAAKNLSRQTFNGHATTLLQTLSLYRRKTKTVRRPIIFAAHSIGGLVLKSALIHASLAGKDHIEHYKAVFTSTYGILFFGTPHQGGNGIALGQLIQNVASVAMQTNKSLLDHLQKDSEWLEENLDHFRFIADRFDTKFFYETVPMKILGISTMVVNKSSAIIPGQSNAESIEIHKNHKEMVRMKSAKDSDYDTISTILQLMCEEAPQLIEGRWREYDGSNNTEFSSNVSNLKIKDDYHLPLQLGYKQNSHFTGRECTLETLKERLTSVSFGCDGESPSAIIVLGIGGVGKTQLARQYAYKYCSHHTSISWINSMGLETIYASFLELARRIVLHYASRNRAAIPPYTNLAQHLGMPGLIDGDGHIVFNHSTRSLVVQAVKGWFSLLGNTGWLLILDNVDDLDSFNIGDFFPTAANGKILITTRRRECTRFGEELELDVLQERESIKLFQRSCQHKQPFIGQGKCKVELYIHSPRDGDEIILNFSIEFEEARRIVEKLGHLPLAIDQAGAYLHTMQKPLASYLPLLHHTKIKATLSRKPPAAVWGYEESVFSTWEMSFSEIQRRHPTAADLLTFCSFFSNVEIQPEMLERGLKLINPGAPEIDESISPLLSFSLIARKNASGSENFSIHPLVHNWSRERLSLKEKINMMNDACKIICTSLRPCEIWTTGVRVPEDWQYERQITPHIETILTWVEQLLTEDEINFKHTCHFITLANVYFYEGRYIDAEKLYLWALSWREKFLSPDHPDVLAVAQGLATVNRFQGRWAESQILYERALEGRKKIDPNHLETLATVQSLAVLYRHKGRLHDCVKLYQWALYGEDNDGNGIESQQGLTHPNTIHTVLGYAIVLQHQGRYEHALKLYEQVLVQRKTKLGDTHPDTLTVKHNLASVLRCLNQLERAEVIFGEVLDAREKYLGPEHPDTLRTADDLANVYRDQGKWEKSEQLYAQALNGREEKLGFGHADTIATVHHVAVSYRIQGKLDEAKVLYLRALEGRERDDRLGRDHLDTLRTVEGLGMIAEAQYKYAEAEKLYQRALDGFRKQMTEDCPDVMRAVENMARILDKLGRHEDALPHHRRLSSVSNSESNVENESEIDRRLGDFRRLSSFSDAENAKDSGLRRWTSNDSRGSQSLSVVSSSDRIRENMNEGMRHLSVSSGSDSFLSSSPDRSRSIDYRYLSVFDAKVTEEGIEMKRDLKG